jgi:hypothetical protein
VILFFLENMHEKPLGYGRYTKTKHFFVFEMKAFFRFLDFSFFKKNSEKCRMFFIPGPYFTM